MSRAVADTSDTESLRAGWWAALCREHPVLVGTVLATISTLCYTGTNVALRSVAKPADFDWSIWVAANKGVISAVVALTICTVQSVRGRPGFPPLRVVPLLLVGGVSTQYLGNLSFQYGLSVGGLALTVPLTFATLITSGAVLGRIFLGEPLRRHTAVAMAVLIGAVIILSFGADEASRSVTDDATTRFKAILAGCLAGIGYGGVGVVIRAARQKDLTAAGTIVYISATGVLGLGLVGAWRVGPEAIFAMSGGDVASLLTASTFNAIAFFAVAGAYGLLSVTRVNLINTSQAAMGAIAGVLFFSEALTGWLVVGTLLTIGGLLLTSLKPQDESSS